MLSYFGHFAVLAVSLVALTRGADLLVEYAARVARRFKVSDLVVGLVITSVGTSLPELASSVAASLARSPGLVVGNIVGSNIANIGLVLGVAAVVRPFAVDPKTHDRDGFILLASASLFFALALDNRIGRIDAGLFLLAYVAYVGFAVRSDREGVAHRFQDFLTFVFDFEYAAPVARRLTRRRAPHRETAPTVERDMQGVGRETAVIALSLIAVIAGAHFAVAEAIWLARLADISENVIGLSVVAVGTSLPELLVAVTAARKGKAEMIVGNVLGSNIANVWLIGGLSGLIRPLDVPELSVVYTVPIMIFFSVGLLRFIRTDWRVARGEGVTAVLAYGGFLAMAFVLGWG